MSQTATDVAESRATLLNEPKFSLVEMEEETSATSHHAQPTQSMGDLRDASDEEDNDFVVYSDASHPAPPFQADIASSLLEGASPFLLLM